MDGEKKNMKTHHLTEDNLKRKISEEESLERPTKKRHQTIRPSQHSWSSDSSADEPFTMKDPLQEQEFPLKTEFTIQYYLGEGYFGNVYLMKHKFSKKKAALKVIKLRNTKQNRVDMEKKVLEEAGDCPFIIKSQVTLQTKNYFWIVMEFAPGGDLQELVEGGFQFDIHSIRFYIAEIISGLRHLHEKGFIHRDLKKQNIFIGDDGHVRIGDFGLATDARVAHEYAGTQGYVAPEIVKDLEYNAEVDYYSLGVILYELATEENDIDYWSDAFLDLDPDLQDLIKKLLRKNPKKRWGFHRDVRCHPFFKDINWDHLQKLHITPPFIPH